MAIKKEIKRDNQDHGRRNFFILLIGLVFLIGIIWGSVYLLRKELFVENPNFTIRYLKLKNIEDGYWSLHQNQLLAIAGVELNRTNLLSVELKEIRERIVNIPSVESCSVKRIMPDTLAIHIVERIPRASIDNPRSAWILDEKGIAMLRLESMNTTRVLPIITNATNRYPIPVGEELAAAKPAVKLLMAAQRNFPDIGIIQIDLANPNTMTFFMKYRNSKLYTVILERHTEQLEYLLNILQSTIINLNRKGDLRKTIDLSFAENVVIR